MFLIQIREAFTHIFDILYVGSPRYIGLAYLKHGVFVVLIPMQSENLTCVSSSILGDLQYFVNIHGK